MKTIYLFRHAAPQRLENVQQEEWPLSIKGHEMSSAVLSRDVLRAAVRVYSSPLLRAVQTAQHAALPLTVDVRLQERRTGMEVAEAGDCWLRQYEDGAFKCPDGESFDEVGQRMQSCMDDILAALASGEAAIVVSHAAAVCAYLMRFCDIRVTERATKTRKIAWQGETLYTGTVPPLTGLRLDFHQGALVNIEMLSYGRGS